MSVYATRIDDLSWGPTVTPTPVPRQAAVFRQPELRYPTLPEPIVSPPMRHANPAPTLSTNTSSLNALLPSGCPYQRNHWVMWVGIAVVIILACLSWHLKNRIDTLEMMVQYMLYQKA